MDYGQHPDADLLSAYLVADAVLGKFAQGRGEAAAETSHKSGAELGKLLEYLIAVRNRAYGTVNRDYSQG